jgi:hypothetical protein
MPTDEALSDAPNAEADEGLDETAEMDAPAELEESSDADAETPAGETEEVDDIFVAMAEMNASDEGFAEAVAEGMPPLEPEVGMDEMVEAGMAAEAAPTEAEPAEPAPEAAEADADPAVEAAEAKADNAAPTVKEIIQRVGDLARELERTEAVRRACLGAEEKAGDDASDKPPLSRAASA